MNTKPTSGQIGIDSWEAANESVAVKFAAPVDTVKDQLFAEHRNDFSANEHLLRLALIEADAIARQTGFPHLFFPQLAAERVQNAARWQFRQRFLLRSNSPYALAA